MPAMETNIAKKLQPSGISPGWSAFSKTHHNNKKSFQLAYFYLVYITKYLALWVVSILGEGADLRK